MSAEKKWIKVQVRINADGVRPLLGNGALGMRGHGKERKNQEAKNKRNRPRSHGALPLPLIFAEVHVQIMSALCDARRSELRAA
jgi:hypothetical protein